MDTFLPAGWPTFLQTPSSLHKLGIYFVNFLLIQGNYMTLVLTEEPQAHRLPFLSP